VELLISFIRDIQNIIFDKVVDKTSMNLADMVMTNAIQFMECLKAMMERQKVFLNTSQTETSKAKRELLQLVNQKLLNNDQLKEKARELLMGFVMIMLKIMIFI
jgi:hypothetical protein